MSKIPAINEIDANSPSQESTEVVVKATTVTPDINEIQETISASATIQEIDGTRKPTISEIYKIVNDGLFESTTNWWDYAYKLSQAQLNQDIISRLDNGVIGGGYSKGVDIITTTSNKVPSNTNVYSALKSDSLYPKKLNDEVINGIYDFLNGLTIGKPTAYTGGTWSVDQMGKTHLTTDYLYVRLKAIFETLQILNVDTIGGKLVISPAGSIKVAYVDRIRIDAPVFKHDENTDVWSISQVEDAEGNLVNETLNQEVYRCYFLGEQDGEEIDNKWKVGDQAQAKTFNVKKGTYHKVENSYLWRLVVNVSSDTVDIDGKKYHYVDLSQIDFDSGSDAPAPGDVLNQLGHRLNDTQRQTALVLNAVDNYAPSITLYAGVNYYTLLNKEYVEFGVYNGKAFFNVYGDMYIGDKGENPKTYIKYKNGKINIKANLEIGSSIGDKDLDQYIKENGGVDEETVNNLINNSQVIKDLQKQTDGAIETWFYEGVPTLDNLPAVDWNTSELKKIHIGDLYYDQTTGYAYRFTKYNDDVNPYRWNRIKDNDIVSALDAANRAQITADGKMKVFYGKTKPTNYQVGDMWVNATLEGKFNNDIARAVADNKTSFNANDWVLASRYSEAIATIQKWTNEYETKFSNLVDEVKQQKDQSIVVWYYNYEPTVDNAPANTWNTDELRSEHIGDIFYDIKNNHSYRWTGTTWIQIKDADFNEAMKAAKAADDKAGAAGDLADSKRRIFYSDTTPTKPFDKGDLWIKRVGDKTETWVYNGTDWVKSDDKALNDFKNAINEELAGIKGQLDGKAETWYQVDDPSTDWTNKASHEGDIWYNTSNGTTNYWNGSAWEQMDIPKDVFDTIDGKSSIFVDSYVDAKAGTGVISKGYKERDLWILPEDATINSVKYYKGDMLTAVSKNTNFDETNWKKKVRYVGPTELNKAIDVVNEKINTINNITIPGINNKFNEFIEDGVLDSSEKARLTDLLNQASNEVAAVIDQVNNIITSKYLTNDNANKGKLKEANTVMKTAWTEYKNLINTLIATNTEITKVNIGEANTKYRNLQEKIKTVKQYLAICQADILSGMGTDITSYKYLKDALNQTTEINGGLVLTSAIQLKDVNKKVTAGMNGIVKGDKTSIAAWYGGPMVDRDTFTSEELETKVPGTDYAMSLLRHDGTGYLAGGNIHWNANGVLSGNFNSFILQGTSIATMFYYIRLFYLHNANQDSTDFNNIDYVTPMKTFSRLSVLPLGGVEGGNNLPTGLFIGDSNTGGSFQIGNIILRTKSGDPNILEIVSASSNKTAHLGVQGGVSAYGTYTPSTGDRGGLNATVISYSKILEGAYTDTDLTSIPNAYSVKALSNRIDNIATELDGLNLSWNNITDKPTTFTPSAHKHKWIDITDRITKVSQLTNDAGYLTTHQSLANYYTRAEIDAKGYTTNKGTVTSVRLTLPTGLTCAINTITTSGTFAVTFASGYSIPTTTKQSSWDSAVSVKHSHSNKTVLDGITSTKVTNWDSAYRWYSLITTDEETADGIINKWNEVVNFLANIAQTDTLSGIIDGINTSISNEVSRAKKAEGTNASNISANKKSITTLQGYFTSGSAKKALQLTTARNLWGNAFNGTADVNGSIVLPSDKYISIGNIKLEYDAINKALKITNTTTDEVANLYASGGVSAYGVGSVAGSGGGGLNGTIVPYSTAITSDPQNEESKIASASSIYKLHSRISAIENNGATSITVTGTGNAITSVSKNGTSITFTKGATFLTTHQSLANYYTRAEIDAKGYTTNKGTVTSVRLTLPTGLTCAINTITTSGTFAVTFASGYSIPTTTKQSSWDSAVSVKHSHSNKTVLDGITSTKVTNWDSAYRWYSLITTDEETADGIINKWNEVVNFLANIAQTDTLSGIIDGINTSISNEVSRAKKAEGTNASNISANKKSITTLQGYFTSGSAKKALQLTTARNLWGNAFNGTADVNGSIVLPSDKYISIGNIKLEYDAINKALKITNTTTDEVANLYASGGVSAYGVGSVAGSGGGGLNGTIVPYSTAITSDPQNEESKIASASSIYKLHSRISAIENNGATSITVTGTGNAITSVSKNGTSITFTKGATFLTTHQSLANYYTKGQVDNIANGKSSTSHTHSVKINGVTKTIAATGGTAVDLGTYLTSHQSLANYAKKSEIPTKVSQLTNDKNFVTGSVSGQTITINGVSTTWQNTWRGITDSYSGTSTGTSLSQKGANSLYNDLHNGYASSAGNSDTVDGYHASGLLTALSNSNNGISITVGGTTKSISNISVNHASNADTATTSSMLKTANWTGARYVPSDTHYMCLGYMNCTDSYDCLTLLVTSAFWGNQHGSQDIITIQQSTNSDDTARIQTTVGRLRLGGSSYNRSFYYYKDDSRFRLYLYVYVIGGNAYGRWNISYLGGNATWVTDHQENVTKSSSWIDIGYSAQVNYASSAGSSDYASKVYGQVKDTGLHELVRCDMNNDQFRIIAGSSGNNNGWVEIATADDGTEPIYVRQYSGVFSSVVRTLTLLDAKGYTHFPSYINIGGNENNNSSPDRVWGSNGSDSYLRSYRTSALNVNYAASAGNAASATKLQTPRTIWGQSFDGTGNVSGSLLEVNNIHFKVDNSYDIGSDAAASRYIYTHWLGARSGRKLELGANNSAFGQGLCIDTNLNVGIGTDSPAYKLHVVGDIYSSSTIRTAAQNKAIVLSNDENPAWISALNGQVIFNTGNAIRFGATNWEYSDWAGLKYDTVANAIYLGIADGTVFNYYDNKRSNGTLKFPGITTITPDSGARIGGSGGDLYLGNANNTNWVKVQKICSHKGSNYWYIYQSGDAHFSNIDVVGDATIGGNCLVKGGVTAYQSSDIRLKINITKLNCLNVIKSIGGTYEFDYIRDHKHSIGFIAQNVNNPLLKDIVAKDDNGYLKINYWNPKLISLAFGALTEIDDEVDKLKARVRELESEVEYLKNKDYVLQ